MTRIVVGSELGEASATRLRAAFPEAEFIAAATEEARQSAIRDADAYIGRITRPVFLAAGPNLRWVHSLGAGVETVASIPEVVESDVTLTNTRGGHAPAIAEHSFAMLLTLTRRIPELVEDQRRHIWRRAEVAGAMRELSGSTMVVVGLGNIGRAIAKRAVGFEMRVLGVDIVPSDPPPGVEAVWPVERLDEALPQADVLSIAAPYTPQTAGLIDGRRVGLLPEGALIIAISRGGILDEAALLEGLRSGRLAGAGLDVFAEEPLPDDSPLWDVPNLLVSPHCSGISWQTGERVWSITADNVRRFLAGEELVNVCDKRAGF